MRQYLPKKPVKRGFKIWVRAEFNSGYFCDFRCTPERQPMRREEENMDWERGLSWICHRILKATITMCIVTTSLLPIHCWRPCCRGESLVVQLHVLALHNYKQLACVYPILGCLAVGEFFFYHSDTLFAVEFGKQCTHWLPKACPSMHSMCKDPLPFQ